MIRDLRRFSVFFFKYTCFQVLRYSNIFVYFSWNNTNTYTYYIFLFRSVSWIYDLYIFIFLYVLVWETLWFPFSRIMKQEPRIQVGSYSAWKQRDAWNKFRRLSKYPGSATIYNFYNINVYTRPCEASNSQKAHSVLRNTLTTSFRNTYQFVMQLCSKY